MKKLILLCSTAVVMPTAAFAQSTGSVDFEKEIVVTGTRNKDVGGIQAPDTPKAKAVVTQEMIARSGPGQNVLDTINIVPGVSFQNNDAYGNAGGTLTVRGFDSTRVSYTLDGIQLNDSGNYNIYSNFSIDPELIEQVNVSLGSTDVDSPTASAVGGTINQRTITPEKKVSARGSLSVGDFSYVRGFGIFHTGELTSSGTRAFIAASKSNYDNPFNNYGQLDRQQYNAKVYQPLGNNGDFISIAGRYNQDRNNFFGSASGLRLDRAVPAGFPTKRSEREYVVASCTVDAPQAGVRDVANGCGTEFDRRYNPSNSINIRGNSRFTLAEGLTLTVDPSYQYTKANGGGTVLGREGTRIINGVEYTGFIGGQYYFGRDLNGDGDVLDTCRYNGAEGSSCSSTASGTNEPNGGVRLLAPSQTRTRRYAVIAGLRYDINDQHSIRATYTYDRANHRQTGQVGTLRYDGEPTDVFAINDPLLTGDGFEMNKRNRQSYAILNQVAAEYRGEIGAATINIGIRAPFFKRDLENFCFTTSANGFLDCFGDPALTDAYAAANPYSYNEDTGVVTGYAPPSHRVLNYHKILPNIGVVYDFTPQISAFASYSKGLSVPSTDNLYNAFYYPAGTPQAKPTPETTDTFDGGVRYRSSKIQAQVAAWFTRFNDRLASAYDPELDKTVYRNLGRVNKHGFDASIAYEPIKELTLYAFGSLNMSKIKDDVQTGTVAGVPVYALTAGKREGGAPKYNFGGSAQAHLGPVELGLTAKRTGPRYVFDTNEPLLSGTTVIYPAKTPAYWLVNVDARLKLEALDPALNKTFIQFNVYNVFDTLYVGGFTPQLNPGAGAPFAQIGAPRTASVTFNVGF